MDHAGAQLSGARCHGQARAAIVDARRALAGDPDKLRHLDQSIAVGSAAAAASAHTRRSPDAATARTERRRRRGASDMSTEQRTTRIRGMVARRRAAQAGWFGPRGWLRLLRAYAVLGRAIEPAPPSPTPAARWLAIPTSCGRSMRLCPVDRNPSGHPATAGCAAVDRSPGRARQTSPPRTICPPISATP